MVGDPRERGDGIGWVSRAVFGDERLWLRTARDATSPPAGHRSVARYAVVPSVERAKFLLPLASRRIGAASTLAYNALRPPRVRANRLAVGVLAGLGATRLARMPVLTVAAPTDVDLAELLLTADLSRVAGRPLHAAIGIRPPDPHHKPTLQLFDDRGVAWAYAKVGWNDATRAMVRAEARALHGLPRDVGDLPAAPRLLREFGWRDLAVTLVEPMPAGVRRLPRPERPEVAAMLAVARRGGPAAPARPLAGSAFLADLIARAERAGGPVGAALAALADRDGATRLEFGDWHGDWVPWNLGIHRGRLFAWDWENSGVGRPVGFDLAHQAFQSALSLRGRSVPEAAGEMTTVLDRYGGRLGLDPARRRLVADAYLVELWLRTAELAAAGGGWSGRLHPALLRVLADRLGSSRG
ncbi:hypothetical protein [Micromonospora eburnea]|uniref:Phosphotransferase enzyme family protein n=1 Tax=Micromonospora eburnea TaxID=227316 RepID=A0A1C6U687_9ACTN|nr:hypothetical protein [Micromonospora eburnea]SCL49542.1 hypothetical protein GA0070604_1934 [Micromonospora eburnea]